jgi:hypothetical protein
MATGMAIMGFGGGAMIGAPLANILMNTFKTSTSVGAWETFIALAAIYFFFMMVGAFRYRLPPAGWRPDGWTPPPAANTMISQHNVDLKDAHKTPQFWLIWWVLCLNVSAGIGVIGMASPMLQEIFAGDLIGQSGVKFNALAADQRVAIAGIAAGFTGLLSLFNIAGRFCWASFSDFIGRKNTYYTFFLLGIALYALAPIAAGLGSKVLFVASFCIILSMYGGGFATVPAYLADMFGTQFVGAADRVVNGRHHRARGGQLPARVSIGSRCATRPALQFHHVCAVFDADRRPDLQPVGKAGQPQMVYERARGRKAAGGQDRRLGAGGLVRHRQGRAQLRRPDLLGLCRRALGVGRVDHLEERGADFLAARTPMRGLATASARGLAHNDIAGPGAEAPGQNRCASMPRPGALHLRGLGCCVLQVGPAGRCALRVCDPDHAWGG